MPRFSKRFGQHHLIQPGFCRPLVDFLRPAGATVLEIGPGGGALTRALLVAGARVLAVEVDLPWALELRHRLRDPRLAIAAADALRLDWPRLAPGYRVAGNLPYNVATPLIDAVLAARPPGSRAAFLVQLEVGERLWAAPGGRDYGALTVLTATRARVERLGRVRASAFRPPPKVDGTFVGFESVEPPFARPEMAAFAASVHAAFASRRKTLRNSLAGGWGRELAEAVLAAAAVDPGTRAEQLPPAAFVAIHRAWSKLSGDPGSGG